MRRVEPVRTCVGCGAREARVALVRFVASGGGLALDVERRAAGRGAWLHRRPECWSAFVRRRGAVRALRSTPTPAERARLAAALAAVVSPEVAR